MRRRMNWEAIGAVGEIAGALGVVVTLVYLARQIRTQNRESRLAAATEWTTQWNGFLGSLAENPRLAELWLKGLQDFSSLNDAEAVQFSSQLGRFFRAAEGLRDQFGQDRLAPETWRGIGRTLEDVARYPGVKAWWPTRSHWYTDDFVAYVKPMIESTERQRLFPGRGAE